MLVFFELDYRAGYSKYNSLIFRCSGPEYAGMDIQSRIIHPGYIFRAGYSKSSIFHPGYIFRAEYSK
jgi:hypothetical protein